MEATTVLVPLDGSDHAEAAIAYAEALARATGASLRLIGVVERESPALESRPDDVRTYVETIRYDSLAQQLNVTASGLNARGFSAQALVVIGDPADEILAAADAADVALVVMATHGRGGLQRMIVGSVADKVMRMGTRPVLLVRPQEKPATDPIALRQVMVPLDGSPLAERALPLAADISRATGATLLLVRVEPFVSAGTASYEAVPDITQFDDEVVTAAEAYLHRVATELPQGVHCETFVLRGFTAASLIEFAEKEGVDLVVMSTHGRGGLRRLAMGSTADRMVRAGTPTLLVRAAPTPAATTATVAMERSFHCAKCHRLITTVPTADERCPRCSTHLHTCINCVFWDTTGCVLQRTEAYTLSWAGRDCPRFIYRATLEPVDGPRLVELRKAV
jgi:nucleotide-binding universal stress UspA family protein